MQGVIMLPIQQIRDNIAHEAKLLLCRAVEDEDVFGRQHKYDLTETQRNSFLQMAARKRDRAIELRRIAAHGTDEECLRTFNEVHFGGISSGGPICI